MATITSVDLMIDDDGVAGGQVEVGGGVLGDRRGQRLTVAEHGLDRRHHLAVVHAGDRAGELVAGAEPQLRPARREPGRADGGPGRGSGAPRGRSPGATGRRGRRRRWSTSARRWPARTAAAGRRAARSLSRPARSRRNSLTSSSVRTSRRCSTGVSSQLLDEPPAGRGGGEDDPVAAPAGGLAGPGDQPLVDQAVDGPVGERPAQRPDPAELAVGGEHRAQRPAVGHLLGDQGQADPLGERQPRRHGHRRSRSRRGPSSGRGGSHTPSVVRSFTDHELRI